MGQVPRAPAPTCSAVNANQNKRPLQDRWLKRACILGDEFNKEPFPGPAPLPSTFLFAVERARDFSSRCPLGQVSFSRHNLHSGLQWARRCASSFQSVCSPRSSGWCNMPSGRGAIQKGAVGCEPCNRRNPLQGRETGNMRTRQHWTQQAPLINVLAPRLYWKAFSINQ